MRSQLGTFSIDDELNVGAVHGEISHRLGCDSNELNQQGWRPYLLPDDLREMQRMAVNLKVQRLDTYRVCAVAKNQERLYLRLQPYLMTRAPRPTLGGAIVLEAWESPRRFFPVGSPASSRRTARMSLERRRAMSRWPFRRVRSDRRHTHQNWIRGLVGQWLAAVVIASA